MYHYFPKIRRLVAPQRDAYRQNFEMELNPARRPHDAGVEGSEGFSQTHVVGALGGCLVLFLVYTTSFSGQERASPVRSSTLALTENVPRSRQHDPLWEAQQRLQRLQEGRPLQPLDPNAGTHFTNPATSVATPRCALSSPGPCSDLPNWESKDGSRCTDYASRNACKATLAGSQQEMGDQASLSEADPEPMAAFGPGGGIPSPYPL